MHHIACLLKVGLHRAYFRTHDSSPSPGKDEGVGSNKVGPKRSIFLGGVTCNFRREIKPYAGYEVWTRVLTWDRKWLYLVSHIVQKGVVKPTAYTLQPWKKGSKGISRTPVKFTNGSANGSAVGENQPAPHPAIYATSIAKYVFKQGRITIPPEAALRHSELLPPRPKGTEMPAPILSKDSVPEGTTVEDTAVQVVGAVTELVTNDLELLDPTAKFTGDPEWTWERVEAQRMRGMEIAKHMAGLDGLMEEWSGEAGPALGEW